MHIKRYTLVSLIFIILVGSYVYAFVTQGSISIDFFGVTLPAFPIAIWVAVPLAVLYIATVLHISFYTMVGSFKLRKYEKDYEKLIDSIVNSYLGNKDVEYTFQTPRYQLLGSLLDHTTLFPDHSMSANTANEKINAAIRIIDDIKNSKVVELKKFSLPITNSLVIQNERNRYKNGDISAEDILSHANKYDRSLCLEAYADFVKTSPFYAIEQYKEFITKESLLEVLARVNADNNTLALSNEELIALIKMVELNSKDYLTLSSALGANMVPDQRIKLFKTLSEEKESAMEGYLFTLFDLERLAPADEILENSQPTEYLNFKAYRALKECNKNFSINLFI